MGPPQPRRWHWHCKHRAAILDLGFTQGPERNSLERLSPPQDGDENDGFRDFAGLKPCIWRSQHRSSMRKGLQHCTVARREHTVETPAYPGIRGKVGFGNAHAQRSGGDPRIWGYLGIDERHRNKERTERNTAGRISGHGNRAMRRWLRGGILHWPSDSAG